MSSATDESRFDEFFDRAWRRSRTSLRTRVNRVRSKAWHIGQCAVAASIAWFVASDLVHHQAPVFAPIVAVVSLGLTYAQRLRRVAEITVGVAIGLAVADLFLALFGTGPLQVGVIVVCAMTTALLLDAGGLLVMQATVQSIFVVALVASPGAAVNRWFDAVIGGAVALVAAAVVPAAALHRPRAQAAIVVETIATLLRDAAQCTRDGDIARAAKVLAEARASDGPLRELQAAASEGLSVIASSPFRRGARESVRSVADLVDPLDRAMRSTRMLMRRAALTTTKHIRVPVTYVVLLDDLADSVGIVARVLGENASASMGRAGILAVGQATADLERGLLSTDVLLAQIRSVVVDMLQVTGMTYEDAVAALPTLPERLVDE